MNGISFYPELSTTDAGADRLRVAIGARVSKEAGQGNRPPVSAAHSRKATQLLHRVASTQP